MDGIYFTYPSIALSLTCNDNSIMGQSPPNLNEGFALIHSHKDKSRVWYPYSTEWFWTHICILNFWQFFFFLVISVSNVGLPCWLPVVKKLHANAGDMDLIPGLGRSLGKGNGSHSSILAWEISWTEKPGGLESIRLQMRQIWLSD